MIIKGNDDTEFNDSEKLWKCARSRFRKQRIYLFNILFHVHVQNNVNKRLIFARTQICIAYGIDVLTIRTKCLFRHQCQIEFLVFSITQNLRGVPHVELSIYYVNT